MSSTQNAIIQNAEPKCKEFTKGIILLLWQLVGYAAIADCSKKTIRGYQSLPPYPLSPTEGEYEGQYHPKNKKNISSLK